MNPSNIVTRFPPSPTGLLQAGNARTAIFNYLFAKKFNGKFILRIEDTDRERSKKEFEDNILDTMQWLGFAYDAFYRQSNNAPRHTQLLQELIEKDLAYVSSESPTEESQRDSVIRLHNPNIPITFTDVVRGPITIDTTDLGDFIIGRSVTEPLYHFGVVVDDMDEGVTHVIRGEDHISNTPRQILIQRALGVMEPPIYAHLPLVMGADHQKLSKRRGAKAMTQYRDEGFLPEAMINYLTLLGWHPEGDKEIFTLIELIDEFNLSRIQKGAGIFDEVKLRWFNHEHMKRLSDEEFSLRLKNFTKQKIDPRVVPLLKERSTTLKEAAEVLETEFNFFENVSYDGELLLNKGKVAAATAKKHLEEIKKIVSKDSGNTTEQESIKALLMPYADTEGRGEVLWPLRVALSGKAKSPDPFTLIWLLGNEEALRRIEVAVELL